MVELSDYFVNLDLGFNSVVWPSSIIKQGGFFSFLGLGVKYDLFKYPLFFAKIGIRYEDFYWQEIITHQYGTNYNYRPFSTLNFQLNLGVNF